MSRIINQNGVVVDLLSHGPIEGLKRGAQSILLDGTPINTSAIVSRADLATTEPITLKAESLSNNTGTRTTTFKVNINSVQEILDKECNAVTGDLLVSKIRYLWVAKAGNFFTGYLQYGTKMQVGGGVGWDQAFSKPYKDFELPYATGPLDGELFFGRETDKSNLHYTFTVDDVPNYRSYIEGIKVNEIYAGAPRGQNAYRRDNDDGLRDTYQEYLEEYQKEATNPEKLRNFKGIVKRFIAKHSIGRDLSYSVTKKSGPGGRITKTSYYNKRSTIRFDYLAEITNIVANPDGATATVTCVHKEGADFNPANELQVDMDARIFASGRAISNLSNFAGGFELHRGTIDQKPSSLVSQAANNLSIALSLNKPLYHDQAYGGDAGSVFIASNAGGRSFGLTNEQVTEVDKLKLTVTFPNGLFFKRDTGKNIAAVCELKGEIKVRNGSNTPFKTSGLPPQS